MNYSVTNYTTKQYCDVANHSNTIGTWYLVQETPFANRWGDFLYKAGFTLFTWAAFSYRPILLYIKYVTKKIKVALLNVSGLRTL